MKFLKYSISIFSLLLIVLFSACSKEKEKESPEVRLQRELNELVAARHQALQDKVKGDVPSLSILIQTPDAKHFITAQGNNGTKVTPTTHFRFASNTKNFTATAILYMMQNGWLNLDDKIVDKIPGTDLTYVPSTASWNFPYKNEITIRQLLQHNAGVYDLTNDASQYDINGETYGDAMKDQNPLHQFSTEEYVKVLTDRQLTYGEPNSVYHYSNTGYSILGEIISRVYSFHAGSQKTYRDYLLDHITGPNSFLPLKVDFIDKATEQQLPSPYVKGMIRLKDELIVVDHANASGHVAEGNGIGTMEELNTYIRSLMTQQNVLNQESLELMRNSVGVATTPQDNNYALGCFHLEGVGYGHNGATEGYLSLMLCDHLNAVSIIVLLPYWDFTGEETFAECMKTINQTALEVKQYFGY